MNKFIINILYKLISLLDYIDYHYIRKKKLIDGYKTIEEIKLPDNIQILTDNGYKPLSHLMISKPFEIYTIILENGYELECADEHIVFDGNFNERFVKGLLIGEYLQTDIGPQKIVSLTKSRTKISMCDTTVNDENHRFYSNGILSHNSTTTAIICLHKILFWNDKKGLLLSKSGPAGRDLLSKIKDMYLWLPYHLKCGTTKWNQSEIAFDNNSSIKTEAFSPTAGLGQTINFLVLDEFAWCPPGDVEMFYTNIIPTVTTISDSNVCIMSTQNGFNLFYRIWKGAIEGKNLYAPFKVDWWQVPQWNPETKQWEKRTEEWRQKMVGVLGSEEDFEYQYGTNFSTSDKCLLTRQTLSRISAEAVLWQPNPALEGVLRISSNDKLVWKPDYNILDYVNMATHEISDGKYYIIACDLAEGGGGDFTVFNIFEMSVHAETGEMCYEHVGRWSSNKTSLADAALDFWIMCCQLFASYQCCITIEWNTYGALFYEYLKNYNDYDYMRNLSWRFNIPYIEGYEYTYFDLTNIVHYKKTSMEEETAKLASGSNIIIKGNLNTRPGYKFSSGNKPTACRLLKLKFERGLIKTTDVMTVNQLENFEDTGNGSYAAVNGNDDSIMTFCQIPMFETTAKYKSMKDDIDMERLKNEMNQGWDPMLMQRNTSYFN